MYEGQKGRRSEWKNGGGMNGNEREKKVVLRSGKWRESESESEMKRQRHIFIAVAPIK